jgi:hypothetical protein
MAPSAAKKKRKFFGKKRAATAEASSAPSAESVGENGAEAEPSDGQTSARWKWLKFFAFSKDTKSRTSAFSTSLVTHIVIIMVLAFLTLPPLEKKELLTLLSPVSETLPEELEEMPLADSEFTLTDSATVATSASAASAEVFSSTPVLTSTAQAISDDMAAEMSDMTPAAPSISLNQLGSDQLMSVMGGSKGVGRAVVDSYDQAFDQLTQEILAMLREGKVLALWCFDQSGSMADDQKVIRDRLERVYTELGLAEEAGDGNLKTAITSFGANFMIHTREPTDKLETIKAAIDEIPVDGSGEEITYLALANAIEQHSSFARKGKRQVAVILVSDESGNRDDIAAHLEATIALAKKNRCRIYTLGREAVFGYPYAHISWKHPQTYVVHYIPVDRGPESAYAEQLQTEGFHRRYDSHPSGYGPFEQSRMARETGGIFFMLPNVEMDVVSLDTRRYRLDAMDLYDPDLRDRRTIMYEIGKDTLRSGLTNLIYEMNPYNEEAAKIIVMRSHFSIIPAEFISQVQIELAKLTIYMNYLDRMRSGLEDVWNLRDKEKEPRWQANADLMRAQLLCYKIRLYEYGSYLQAFVENPKSAEATKPPNLDFVHWQLTRRQEMITGEVTAEYVKEAKQLFAAVIENHPETPWAGRAEKEMSSGFGVELTAEYREIIPPGGGDEPLIPVPKL